jgi:hypothetical protein
MSGNAYKALGFIVFKTAKTYLRYRYSFPKRVAFGVVAFAATAVAGAIARRRNGGA